MFCVEVNGLISGRAYKRQLTVIRGKRPLYTVDSDGVLPVKYSIA